MRRIFVLLIAVILALSMAVSADILSDTGYSELPASFAVYPQFQGNSMVLKLSGLSTETGLSISYDPRKGFLKVGDGSYIAYIKELDDNIKFDENSISIIPAEGESISYPYSFRLFMYICGREPGTSQGNSLSEPRSYYGAAEEIFTEVEATLEPDVDKLKLTLKKKGKSNERIDAQNLGTFLNNNLLLVNRSNTLASSYIPPGLIYGKPARGRSTVSLRLDREALENLNGMLETAYKEGISGMVITSAFRTYEKQTSLFNSKTLTLSRKMNRLTAMEEASKVVAIPGSSEHQTGLAADIISESTGLVKSFGNTAQGRWLEDNSWRFGFIIRYPKDKTDITGIIYEPWHVRYIGAGHSELMKSRNMCLEEYVDYLKENRLVFFEGSRSDSYLIRYMGREELGSAGSMLLSLEEGSTWSISRCTGEDYVLTIKL